MKNVVEYGLLLVPLIYLKTHGPKGLNKNNKPAINYILNNMKNEEFIKAYKIQLKLDVWLFENYKDVFHDIIKKFIQIEYLEKQLSTML